MKIIRRAFLLGWATLSLLLLTPGEAHAQLPPSTGYLFVEVRDTAGTALADATVRLSAADGKQALSEKTDKGGAARREFVVSHESYYDLRVSKDGYLTSEHVLYFSRFGRSPYSVEEIPPVAWGAGAPPESPIKIVLAGNPVTAAEREAAEVEGRKRRLLLAAKRGDAAGVRKLLEAGVSANAANARGVPAIAWAALAGDPETIKVLLAAGADVREGNHPGRQALLIYLSEGVLREWNASRRRVYPAGTVSPMSLRELREETVRRLIAAGAAVNVPNSPRGTVLNNAVNHAPTYTLPPEILSVKPVKALIAAGADVNAGDTHGQVALMLAVRKRSVELVRILLAADASVNAKDKLGRTPLMYAIDQSRVADFDVVKALIAAGANVNAADGEGRTALMLAAGQDDVRAVKTLLEAGASVAAKDRQGRTALTYAEMASEVIKALKAAAGGERKARTR